MFWRAQILTSLKQLSILWTAEDLKISKHRFSTLVLHIYKNANISKSPPAPPKKKKIQRTLNLGHIRTLIIIGKLVSRFVISIELFHCLPCYTFALLHFNIRSINKHSEELQLLLNYHNKQTFPVIALTETWLSSNSTQPFTLNGYELIVNNRLNRMGGGVALYVPQCFEFTVYEELNVMNDSIESLFIEIPIPKNKNIVIGVIYRPPNSNTNEFLTYPFKFDK